MAKPVHEIFTLVAVGFNHPQEIQEVATFGKTTMTIEVRRNHSNIFELLN
ncbi:MAG: hypothetical protein GY896_06900 [Gammaproteobacteria bacterium]|nr:hypothetical protein [Gammaproteobacteria bacterium]